MNRFRVFLLTLCLLLIQPTFAQTPTKSASTPTSNQPESAPPPATVTGSGTADYIPLWTGSTVLGDSKIYQTGGFVGIGTTTPAVALDVSGRVGVSKAYRIANVDVLAMPGGLGDGNIAVGYEALVHNTSGISNTAIGYGALQSNNTGFDNMASGSFALQNNTTGSDNTACAEFALMSNTTGFGNTASGNAALEFNTAGNGNTADGYQALVGVTGSYNIGIGYQSAENTSSGSSNIAIGYRAANNVTGANSNNIHIANEGTSSDNGTIRIGTAGTQTTFFAAGIYGVSAGNNDAIPVLIDSAGQLVTLSSSRRFKEDVQDMADASRGLMQLRPVTFRYKKPLADGSQPLQYGLIAEEVAEVYPDLVTHSSDGQIETVKYQVLNSMLLNEVQRQQAEIRALQERLDRMDAALAAMSPNSPTR
jgi:hypothetical protein